MESLLGASTEAWQAVRIRERVDDAMNLDERAWPRVAEENRNSVLVLGAFVNKVNPERLSRSGGGGRGDLNGGAELRQGSIEVCLLRSPVIILYPIEHVSIIKP